MRKAVLCLILAVTAILQLALDGICASPSPRLVPVSGRVLDALTDKPIPGALIGVYQSGQKAMKADSKGRFKVLGMPGSKCIVYYDGGNDLYRTDSTTYTTVNIPAKGLSGVTLRLWKKEFNFGKVFAPNGTPLAGATVTIGGAYFTHAVTDSKGKYKIEIPMEEKNPGG